MTERLGPSQNRQLFPLFGTNNIITCTVNMETKKLHFKKKTETYELSFEKISNSKVSLQSAENDKDKF